PDAASTTSATATAPACETSRTASTPRRRVSRPPAKSAVPHSSEDESARTAASISAAYERAPDRPPGGRSLRLRPPAGRMSDFRQGVDRVNLGVLLPSRN